MDNHELRDELLREAKPYLRPWLDDLAGRLDLEEGDENLGVIAAALFATWCNGRNAGGAEVASKAIPILDKLGVRVEFERFEWAREDAGD